MLGITSEKQAGRQEWFKSPVTMRYLLEDNEVLLKKFRAMCEFFSMYFPLGELGCRLEERCKGELVKLSEKEKDHAKEDEDKEKDDDLSDNIFWFKHRYVQDSIYDYNLIDLLVAIENNAVCEIEYSHAIRPQCVKETVIPLEVRISVVNGREYILYYQPEEEQIKALRLEFIDKITVFADAVYDSGVIRKMKLAKEMLPYIWGVEVPKCKVSKDWKKNLYRYTLPVKYEKTEGYIADRLRKEIRNAESYQSITLFPTKELRVWARSYYQRITHVAELNRVDFDMIRVDFDMIEDIECMYNIYFSAQGKLKQDEEKESSPQKIKYTGKKLSEYEGHAGLFNELFSKYAIILANSILACSGENNTNILDSLAENIDPADPFFPGIRQVEKREILLEYVRRSELIDNYGKPRFHISLEDKSNYDYLYDLLPLTKVEVRWLMTVLNHPLAAVFLEPETIEEMKRKLYEAPFEVKEYEFSKINYFDRHHAQKDVNPVILKQIYQAIQYGDRISVKYTNWSGKEKTTNCAPIRIEYSKKDDTFRIWYVARKAEQIFKINLPRVKEVEVLKRKYDLTEERHYMEKLYQKTETSIQVEFYEGHRNLPDRILTEFSLWKKNCVRDSETCKYTMTLWYSTMDEKEILIRLLCYGPYIRIIADDDNYVLREMKNRIAKQRELFRGREQER